MKLVREMEEKRIQPHTGRARQQLWWGKSHEKSISSQRKELELQSALDCLQWRQVARAQREGDEPTEGQETYTKEKMRDSERNKGQRTSAGREQEDRRNGSRLLSWQHRAAWGWEEGQCQLQHFALPFQQQQAQGGAMGFTGDAVGRDAARDSKRAKVKKSVSCRWCKRS